MTRSCPIWLQPFQLQILFSYDSITQVLLSPGRVFSQMLLLILDSSCQYLLVWLMRLYPLHLHVKDTLSGKSKLGSALISLRFSFIAWTAMELHQMDLLLRICCAVVKSIADCLLSLHPGPAPAF